MAKRMLAVAAAVVVAAGFAVGGVLVASRGAQREPAKLSGLQVESGQAGRNAAAAGAGQAAPAQSPTARAVPQADGPGPVRYQVRGTLPELPRSARAWTLDQRVSAADVAALAAKLGLAGQPKQEELAWTVSDGTRQLRVSKIPGLPWTFGTPGTVCGGPMGDSVAPKNKAVPCAAIGPEPGQVPQPASPSTSVRAVPPQPVQLPDRARAERIARDLLGRLGVQLDGAELQLTPAFDRWLAVAAPRVGGMPTSGFSWTVGIGAKGAVISGSGWLATPRPGDTYPLISVQQALDRLRKQGALPGPITQAGPPKPLPSPVRPLCRSGDEAKGCPPSPPLAPPTLTVTGVRLGLQLASALPPSGRGQRVDYLVPAYFFQLEHSWARQVTVIAVQDRFLTTPTPPTVVPLPQRTR
jgi:hypothetical protein